MEIAAQKVPLATTSWLNFFSNLTGCVARSLWPWSLSHSRCGAPMLSAARLHSLWAEVTRTASAQGLRWEAAIHRASPCRCHTELAFWSYSQTSNNCLMSYNCHQWVL